MRVSGTAGLQRGRAKNSPCQWHKALSIGQITSLHKRVTVHLLPAKIYSWIRYQQVHYVDPSQWVIKEYVTKLELTFLIFGHRCNCIPSINMIICKIIHVRHRNAAHVLIGLLSQKEKRQTQRERDAIIIFVRRMNCKLLRLYSESPVMQDIVEYLSSFSQLKPR